MEDNRIQNQIAIYMTNKKLCEFTDKLKPAPIEYYAHMHAQGEEQADGIRAYSCIGVVLQDYSNGTGDKTVRVTANLSPGFFPFVLSRISKSIQSCPYPCIGYLERQFIINATLCTVQLLIMRTLHSD